MKCAEPRMDAGPCPTAWGRVLCCGLLMACGCHGRSILRDPGVLEKAATAQPEADELVFQAGQWDVAQTPEPGTPQGDLRIAEALFRAEDYERAEKAFDEVADNHKDHPDVHQRALFMKGEAQYQQARYTAARDTYDELVKLYPGSRHVAAVVEREFSIADKWLDDARDDARRGNPGAFPRRFVTVDRSKPVFDIDGHSIKLLEHVREYDPNGNLSDDSLMMTAGYYYSLGDYRNADLYYDQLVHNYPRSEFQAQAHVLGAQAKLEAYKGPHYDGRKLEEARRMLEAATQFPELDANRPKLYRTLDAIKQQQAERELEVAEFYRRTGKPRAARLYYQLVMKNYPDTKWAEEARQRIDTLPPDEAETTTSDAQAPPRGVRERVAQWFGARGESQEPVREFDAPSPSDTTPDAMPSEAVPRTR